MHNCEWIWIHSPSFSHFFAKFPLTGLTPCEERFGILHFLGRIRSVSSLKHGNRQPNKTGIQTMYHCHDVYCIWIHIYQCIYRPGPSKKNVKLVPKGCQFTIPQDFNWHPLEGVGSGVGIVSLHMIYHVHRAHASSCTIFLPAFTKDATCSLAWETKNQGILFKPRVWKFQWSYNSRDFSGTPKGGTPTKGEFILP